MNWTKESIWQVLKEINESVPENLRKNVVREVKASPTIEMVMTKAATMESIAPEKRKQIQALLDSGEFSKMRVQEDPKIAKMIDNCVNRKINQAIKEGRLPGKKQLAEIMKQDEQTHNSSSQGEDSNP